MSGSTTHYWAASPQRRARDLELRRVRTADAPAHTGVVTLAWKEMSRPLGVFKLKTRSDAQRRGLQSSRCSEDVTHFWRDA